METLRTDSSQLVEEGRETMSATDSGPDGTHKKQCERDWGFETRPRHSSRSGQSLSVTTTRPQSALGDTTTHHDGRRRWPPTTSRWQAGRAFHFHTTRLKRFRSPETLHLEVSWNLPTAGDGPQKTKSGAGVGVFLNAFWKLPDFCAKPGALENCLARPCFGRLDATECECTI